MGNFVNREMNAGRILSHGQITDLTSAFSLKNDIPFSLFIIPKSDGSYADDTTATVDCKLYKETASADCPFTLNCWDAPAVIQVATSGIDLTEYDVYWGAGTEAEAAS